MTTTLDRPADELMSYSYEAVDVSQIPTRPRSISPGRRSENPHLDIVASIAGTGNAAAFTVPVENVDDEAEVRKIANRHGRWLRSAAAKHDRGMRISPFLRRDDSELKIFFQDTDVTRR